MYENPKTGCLTERAMPNVLTAKHVKTQSYSLFREFTTKKRDCQL